MLASLIFLLATNNLLESNMRKRLSRQAAHQYSKRIAWVHCLNCRKSSSTKYLIQKDTKTGRTPNFFLKASVSVTLWSWRYRIRYRQRSSSLWYCCTATDNTNSWMNIRHLLTIGTLKKWLSSLVQWLRLHSSKGEQFFQGRPKYFAVVLKYSFRGNIFYRGPNLM